jgi:hypothetical protein
MSECCSVKAPDIPAAVMSCPECGSRSKQVDTLTVKSLVWHLPFGMAPAQYYFCEAPAPVRERLALPERPQKFKVPFLTNSKPGEYAWHNILIF